MSLLKDIWSSVSGIAKGMGKTYDEQFDPVFTEMYPFEQPQLPPVSCQSLALIKDENGEDRCVSCLACEKICPSQVITIERKRNPAGKGFVLERFDIDLVNCMYCAMCVEVCPASAIVTIQDFELSTFNLQTLKADKDFLDDQGLRAQQWYSPKLGVEYREGEKIVVAPIEEQPGGLARMEEARLKAESAPAAAIVAPPARPAAAVVPAAQGSIVPAAQGSIVPAADGSVVPAGEGTVVLAADASAEPAAAPRLAADPDRPRKGKVWVPKDRPVEPGPAEPRKDGEA